MFLALEEQKERRATGERRHVGIRAHQAVPRTGRERERKRERSAAAISGHVSIETFRVSNKARGIISADDDDAAIV